MRPTPYNTTILARIGLVFGAGLMIAGTLGPLHPPEGPGLDKMAHFAAFYALPLLACVALPRMRKLDLAVAAMVLGVGIEIIQGVVGRDAEIGDAVADILGTAAMLAPTYLDRLRHLQRAHSHESFSLIRARDRRQGSQRARIPLDRQARS